jgi:hypothetical protein
MPSVAPRSSSAATTVPSWWPWRSGTGAASWAPGPPTSSPAAAGRTPTWRGATVAPRPVEGYERVFGRLWVRLSLQGLNCHVGVPEADPASATSHLFGTCTQCSHPACRARLPAAGGKRVFGYSAGRCRSTRLAAGSHLTRRAEVPKPIGSFELLASKTELPRAPERASGGWLGATHICALTGTLRATARTGGSAHRRLRLPSLPPPLPTVAG